MTRLALALLFVIAGLQARIFGALLRNTPGDQPRPEIVAAEPRICGRPEGGETSTKDGGEAPTTPQGGR